MLGAVTRRLPAGLQVCEALQGDNIPQRQIQTLAGQRNVNRQPHKALTDRRRTADSCLYIKCFYICVMEVSLICIVEIQCFCFQKHYNHFRYT